MIAQAILFEEEQTFSKAWAGLMLGIMGCVALLFASIALLEPAKAGGMMTSSILMAVVLGGITVLLYTTRLKVRVDAEHIHIHYFPFFKRDIPLADIDQWEPRTYRPIVEYGGWGIRSSWGGRNSAYNMKGNQGVQLVFANGKRLLIGSQRAEEFTAAISEAKRQ
jgi:hypothetical protein